MKIFFSLLLLANIGFVLMQWLLPYEQLFVETPKIEVSERLQLLNEPGKTSEVSSAEASASKDNNILVAENSSNQLICYTIGPFKDKTRALEISGRYSANKIKPQLKSRKEQEYMGIMVYLPGHKSREEAIKTAKALAKQGIQEYLIVNKDDEPNLLSLGVFGLKKNADRLIAKLEQLKYPVKSEARYRERTIYWLYYQRSNESEKTLLLDQKDIENGIGEIPGQCA